MDMNVKDIKHRNIFYIQLNYVSNITAVVQWEFMLLKFHTYYLAYSYKYLSFLRYPSNPAFHLVMELSQMIKSYTQGKHTNEIIFFIVKQILISTCIKNSPLKASFDIVS